MSDKKDEVPEDDIEKPLFQVRKILEQPPPKTEDGNLPDGYDSGKDTEDRVIEVRKLVGSYFEKIWFGQRKKNPKDKFLRDNFQQRMDFFYEHSNLMYGNEIQLKVYERLRDEIE